MWIYGGNANHARGDKSAKRRDVDLVKLWESERKDVSIWRERGEYFARRPSEWIRLPVTTVREAIAHVVGNTNAPACGLEEV